MILVSKLKEETLFPNKNLIKNDNIDIYKGCCSRLIFKRKKTPLINTTILSNCLTILRKWEHTKELPFLAALANQQVRQWPRLLCPSRSSPNPHAEPASVSSHGPAAHPTRARTCAPSAGHWRCGRPVPCVCFVLLGVAVLLGEQRLRRTAFFGGPGVKSFYSQ